VGEDHSVTRGCLALVLAAAGLGSALPASAQASLRFHGCGEARCAHLSVPLDRSGAVPGRLRLRVERHDTFGRVKRGLTLVLPGLPGFAGTALNEGEWQAPGRDVILFDQRGTGAGALRCRDLEAVAPTDAGREAAACATLLGDRRGFFRTSDTVEDIEALRVELAVERLTIVGTAYGAYVAQRYAMRYPGRVERMLLESPVDAAGLDPRYVDSMAAARRVLPTLCRPGCGSFTRDPLADTGRLVEVLAAAPLRGKVVGPRGHGRTALLTREDLLYLLLSGDDDLITRPEYPAAVVSALRGDPAPILRMTRRATAHPLQLRPRIASAATYAATLCEELRFPGGTAMDRALAAPFDPETLARSDLMNLCREWPRASSGPPPEPGPMPEVPVLVLAARETIRSALETARRTAGRFPRGQLLETPGLLPPLFFGGGDCAGLAVERFLNGRRVPERCPRGRGFTVPLGRPAPVSLSELRPVQGVPGRRGRLLRALGMTLGDLVDTFYSGPLLNIGQEDFEAGFRVGGLRGGRFAITGRAVLLDRYEYVPGVRLTSRWKSGAVNLGPMRIDGPGSLNGRLRIREGPDELFFRVRGRIAGRRVRARLRVESRIADAFRQVEEDGGGSARAAGLGTLLR
jgi:pimeloyl-ACP methyl ester carboxylesterase